MRIGERGEAMPIIVICRWPATPAFFAFIAAVLLKGFRSLKRVKDPFLYSLILGISLGLVAFLLHSAVDVNLYSLPLATLFWLSSGILLAVIKISESELGTISEQ